MPGATKTTSWAGSSGYWSVASNWTGGAVPDSSTAVTISGASGLSVSLTGVTQAYSLVETLVNPTSAPGVTISVSGGLTLGGALTLTAAPGAEFTASTFSMTSGASVSATGGVTIGAYDLLTASGTSGSVQSLSANVVNNGTIASEAGGKLLITGNISGAGDIDIDDSGAGSASVEIAGSVTGQDILLYATSTLKLDQAANFSGVLFVEGNSTLDLDGATTFAGDIALFAKGVTLDLKGVSVASYAYANDVLDLKETGGQTLALNAFVFPSGFPGSWAFSGGYAMPSGYGILLASDGNGGTDVSFNTVTAPTVYVNYIPAFSSPTNNANQVISGTVDKADAGTVVQVFDGSVLLGSATVAANGSWSTPITLASDGQHVITAKDTAFSGAIGTSYAHTITLDRVAPVVTITSEGGSTNQPLQTISGAVDVADANLGVEIFDGSTQIGSTYVQADGSWSAVVPLTGAGENSITATVTDLATNKGVSNAITFQLGPFSGLTVDTGSTRTIAYPNAISTSVLGANAAGLYFGSYVDNAGTHAFTYNSAANVYQTVTPPNGSSFYFDGIGEDGEAWGSYTDTTGAQQALIYDPTTQQFTSINSALGAFEQDNSVSVRGISSSGVAYGTEQTSTFYGSGETTTLFALSTQQTQTLPLDQGGTPYLQSIGMTDTGLVYGTYSDMNSGDQSFVWDTTTGAVTYLSDPSADTNFEGATTLLGVTDAGLGYGYYLDASDVQRGFTYNVMTGAYTDVALPTQTLEYVTIFGANNEGLLYGYYNDASGRSFFIYDSSTQSTTIIDGPPGATNIDVEGLSNSGIATGSYTDANGSELSFLYNLATGAYTSLAAPGMPVGGYTNIVGIGPQGLVYGDYSDAFEKPRYFVYDPSTGLYGEPGGLLGAEANSFNELSADVSESGAVFGNYNVGATGNGSAFVYTPGGNSLSSGQSATFALAVNNEALTVSSGAALLLSNGGKAVYDANLSSANALAFVYTAGAYSEQNATDLSVVGFTGSITDPSGASVDPTSFLTLDTHIGVDLTVTSKATVTISSTIALTSHPQFSLVGTIDVADASQTVTIYDGATVVGVATPATDGSWTATVSLSGDGAHTLRAEAPTLRAYWRKALLWSSRWTPLRRR